MAEKTVISIEVEGTGKAINSIKELKAELKAAQSAALNGDGKAAKRVAELKDKMDDLKDTTKSLQGSGVEKISSGFSMLGQGFKDFDFDKIKTGFKGVGSAMSAIPIFLIIEGISYLVQNWKELSEGNGLVAKSLQFLGDIFTSITDVIYEFTDAIGLTNTELDKQGDAIKGFAEKSNAALNEQSQSFDRQIAVAKASGKNTVELEKQKQQAIIDTNYLIAKQIEAFVRAGGELDAEKSKQLTASLDLIKNAKVKEYEITKEDDKAKASKYKEYLDKQKELRDKAESQRLLDLQKAKEDEAAIELQSQQAINADKVVNEQYTQDEINAIRAAESAKRYEGELAQTKAQTEAQKQLKQEELRGAFELTEKSLIASQNLSNAFFAIKMANVRKGSKEEEDLARKQFNINKGIQISLAIISGVQGVLNALSAKSILPEPFATGVRIANAIAVGTASIAAVAKISSTQFQSAGGGGAPSISAGSSTSSPSMPAGNGTPSIAAPQQNTTTFTGNNNNNFNQPPIKTYVVETDLRNSTNTIDKIKDQATF
jgi:hypothetical protein